MRSDRENEARRRTLAFAIPLVLASAVLAACAGPPGKDPRAALVCSYAAYADVDSLRALLKEDPKLANAQDENGRPALFAAVRAAGQRLHGHETVRLLLESGADPRVAFWPSRYTPLHAAALHAGAETIEALLAHGAPIDARTKEGLTPLLMAIGNGRGPDAARALIRRGADVNAAARGGMTALHLAIAENDVELVDLLIERGADVRTRDGKGRAPEEIAIQPAVRERVQRALRASSGEAATKR